MQERAHSFGYWLRRRRKALDLTQEALGKRVSCSAFAIRKIEADQRRPSRALAERLAAALAIASDEHSAFLDAARAIRTSADLAIAAEPVASVDESAPALGQPSSRNANEATPFIGRDVEYGLLIGLVARLTTGQGQTVLIEGEPGIGKSRLMRETARYAEKQGIAALAVSCYEIDRATPYRPVIDLVAAALDRISNSALCKLAPVSLAELAALEPRVADRVANLPQLARDFPEVRQARLGRAVGQLIEAIAAGRPLVLMVDDIHWADDASAQVLHSLARHVAERPALLIYAYRDENVHSDQRFARLIESLRRETEARWLPLSRLRVTDAQQLIAALGLATPGLAERLHHETEGNPFFLVSILQSLGESDRALDVPASGRAAMLPDALRAAVRARISRVPAEHRAALDAAAVTGRRFDFDVLLDAMRISEERLLDALDALTQRRLLREESEGGVYDFVHDKVREVIYEDLGGARRMVLHRSIAETIERRGEGDAHERDARLAEHYERGHVWSKALKYLLSAAEHSQRLFAMRDALHWLDRAVALVEAHPETAAESERRALYARRGAARAQAGQTEGAVADIERVIEAACAAGDRRQARDALIQLGMAHRRADAYDRATACLNEALSESRAMSDERQAADTLYHLGTVAWSTGRNDDAIACHQQAVDICEKTQLCDLIAVQAFHGRGEAHFAYAEPTAAITCYERSIALAKGIGDKSYECENLMMIGYACTGAKGLGDYARARSNFEAALDIARAADLQWHMGPSLLGLEHVRACMGEYGLAWSGMLETLEWLTGLHQVRYQMIAFDAIGHLLLDINANERAMEFMERGLALSRRTGVEFWRTALEAHRAIARSRLGHSGGEMELRDALGRTRRNSERYMTVRCLEGLAEVTVRKGDAVACRDYATELLSIAQGNGLRELEAAAFRWRGESLLHERDFSAAEKELLQAAQLANEVGRVRVKREVAQALERLYGMQGREEEAQLHAQASKAMAESIDRSLAACELGVRV